MKPHRVIRLKQLFFAVAISVFMINPKFVEAAEDELTLRSVTKFAAGILSGALIHEASHAAVAGLTGIPLNWEGGNYNQPLAFTAYTDNNAKGLAIFSAGLIAQPVGTEIILRVDRIDKNDSFVRGMMTWNILNPIMYSLDYWFFHLTNKSTGATTFQGDLQGVEYYSNKTTADGFSLFITAIAVYQGYRFLQTQSWAPDWLKGKSQKLHLAPLPPGGLMLTYKFDF
jgi:hypothetical protein